MIIIFKKNKSKKTTIFKGNSFDFSNSITYGSKKINVNLKNFSVLIDSTGPRFKDEHIIFNNQQTHTLKNGIQNVNKFFDFGKKFQNKIKICPHPKIKTKNIRKILVVVKIFKINYSL